MHYQAVLNDYLLWYEAGADQEQCRTIGNNSPGVYTKIKLIFNQLDLLVVYIASLNPSEIKKTINLPLTYNTDVNDARLLPRI